MRRHLRTAIPVLASMALLLTTGCSSKKNLDQNVDKLVKAVLADDYAAFRAMSVDELAREFPREKFTVLSKALGRLGAYQERTMKGIQVKSGGLREGRYTLRFAKASLALKITLVRGKLTAFRFEGKAINDAIAQVRTERFRHFKVGRFHWRDAQNARRTSNVYAVGEPLHFYAEIWGMTRSDGHLKLRVDLQVTGDGKVLLSRPGFIDKAIPLPAADPPVANVTGNVRIPRAGSYTLVLTITDVASKRRLVERQAFRVEGK